MKTISIEALAHVTGGASLGNTLRAGAVAGMGLVAGEEGPKFPVLDPAGQTTSQPGSAGRAPFQPLQLPGGGMATFGG
jgi:bacteriocin-like protein